MDQFSQQSQDYYRIEKAIQFLEEHFRRQPSLQEVAQAAGLNEFYFQRLFQRWAGISPKRFLQFLTKEYVKQLLAKSTLLDASYDAGLSGPGRLHDLFVNCEAMSPGEYKQGGKGLILHYGFYFSPFGECFIAWTSRGICQLVFLESRRQEEFLRQFRAQWNNASLMKDQAGAQEYIRKIFSKPGKKRISLNVLCRGTNFQLKVWEALLRIPPGKVVTYKTIAETIGSPRALRAVGNAVGKNPIAYLIPCHRVIRGAGHFGGYRWGTSRKKMILAMETRTF